MCTERHAQELAVESQRYASPKDATPGVAPCAEGVKERLSSLFRFLSSDTIRFGLIPHSGWGAGLLPSIRPRGSRRSPDIPIVR